MGNCHVAILAQNHNIPDIHGMSNFAALLQRVGGIKMAMTDLVTTYSNGVKSPSVQLGTYKIKKAEEVATSVLSALGAGYRAIDTAEVYRNHNKIATALASALPSLGLTRQDIFITSKLHPKDHGTEKCQEAVDKVLKDLDTEYLDLFLIHWPGVQKLDVKDPLNRNMRAESWKVLERNYKNKKFRSIGVSNYTLEHMKELLENCDVVPHVLQIELHPHYQQRELVSFCATQGIHVQAYSSLGQEGTNSPLFSSEVVMQVSTKLGRSPAQVLLRWGVQQGFTIMPKSVHPDRIKENFNLDFVIPPADMDRLDNLEENVVEKYAWDPSTVL